MLTTILALIYLWPSTALSYPPTEEEEAMLRRILLEEDRDRLILAVLPVTDVFDDADVIHVAKRVGELINPRTNGCLIGWLTG